MRWLVQEARLRALFNNIIKIASEDDWPSDMMVFLTHICKERTNLPNTFLLPFEIKILSIMNSPNYKKDKDTEENRKILVVSCFLIVKVLVSKMFFKPYRIAQYFDKDINILPDKLQYKENCVSTGYTLLVMLSTYYFDKFRHEIEFSFGKQFKSKEEIRGI